MHPQFSVELNVLSSQSIRNHYGFMNNNFDISVQQLQI